MIDWRELEKPDTLRALLNKCLQDLGLKYTLTLQEVRRDNFAFARTATATHSHTTHIPPPPHPSVSLASACAVVLRLAGRGPRRHDNGAHAMHHVHRVRCGIAPPSTRRAAAHRNETAH